MASKSAIIIVAIVVIVIAIAGIAALASSDDSNEDTPAVSPESPSTPPASSESTDTADVLIGWRATLESSLYQKSLDMYDYPDEGKQFVLVHYAVRNVDYDPGISLNYIGTLTWRMTYNNIEYNSVANCIWLDEYHDVTVLKDGTATSVVTFEVDSSATLDDLSFSVYHDKAITFEYDQSLVLLTY